MKSPIVCLIVCTLFHAGGAHAEPSHDAMDDMPGMEMDSGSSANSMSMMAAQYGQYSMMREASGTSWQPDSTPMNGWNFDADDWSFMAHGYANGVYDNQGGERGGEKFFSTNMAMLMGSRPLGDGTFGVRSMLSLEPLMGKNGYPELLQSGETANGSTPLIDRQHPHDLFMEMALTYTLPVNKDTSVFIYGGLPGEPALGPPAFMHRTSGVDIQDAPITHHWLDSTHITEGVLTGGYVFDDLKMEGSVFNGREPNQDRYDIETRALDSWSGRFSYNPTDNWSTQISYGELKSPEQLTPGIEVKRTTASATYNLPFDGNNFATTMAWGSNRNDPGKTSNGYLIESELTLNRTHTFFQRIEDVRKDELFEDPDPRAGNAYTVNRIALGYIYDFLKFEHVQYGIGAESVTAILPASLDKAYGDNPSSFLVFVRAKVMYAG